MSDSLFLFLLELFGIQLWPVFMVTTIAALALILFLMTVVTCFVGCRLKKIERRIKMVDVREREATTTDFEVQGVPEKLHF